MCTHAWHACHQIFLLSCSAALVAVEPLPHSMSQAHSMALRDIVPTTQPSVLAALTSTTGPARPSATARINVLRRSLVMNPAGLMVQHIVPVPRCKHSVPKCRMGCILAPAKRARLAKAMMPHIKPPTWAMHVHCMLHAGGYANP